MVRAILSGKTFTQAHKIAMKLVGQQKGVIMPYGKGTYGKKKGRPPKKKTGKKKK